MDERSLAFYDLAPLGFITLAGDGLIVDANRCAESLLGAERDSLASLSLGAFVDPDYSAQFSLFRDRLAESLAPQSIELGMRRRDGAPFWARIDASSLREGGAHLCRVVLSDVSERRLRHEGRTLTARLIVGLIEPGNIRERMSELSGALHEWTGCEAVGIRLREGEDYPYFETRGFPPEFVEAERRLCAYGPDGRILRELGGNPVLDCMCGNVLCGRFDPDKAFFTAKGSFWSNGTTALLASTTEADRQARTRNRCNGEGYESVALIALRVGDEVLGLLQFNDRRTDRFSPELIADYESMADSLAIALSRRRAEEALEESERRYRTVAEFTWDWETWRSPEGDYLYVSPSCERVTGYTAREFMDDPALALRIVLEEDRPALEEHYGREGDRDDGGPRHLDFRIVSKGGETRWISHYCRQIVDAEGRHRGRRASNRDITDRKEAESRIASLLEEKEILLHEVHHRIKNNMSAIGSLLSLQSSMGRKDQSPKDILEDAQRRLKSMGLLYDKLYRSENVQAMAVGDYLRPLIEEIVGTFPPGIPVRIESSFEEFTLTMKVLPPLGMAVNEIVTNSMKYAFAGRKAGRIIARASLSGGRATLALGDDGIGLPASVDVGSSASFGLSLVRTLVQQIDGRVDIVREGGTTYILEFDLG